MPGAKFKLELPLDKNTRITALGGRLFFTSREFIAEFHPDGSVKLLTSTRRKPSVTQLNTLGWSSTPELQATDGASLLAVFSQPPFGWVPWLYGRAPGEWQKLPALQVSDISRESVDGQLLFTKAPPLAAWTHS